jgi:hypothetical protein
MTIKGVQKILRERGIRHVIGLGTVPEAEPAPAAPAPAPKPKPRVAAPPNGGPPPAPQPDLFDAPRAPATARPAAVQPKPLDKSALKTLLAELMALRAVMTDESAR